MSVLTLTLRGFPAVRYSEIEGIAPDEAITANAAVRKYIGIEAHNRNTQKAYIDLCHCLARLVARYRGAELPSHQMASRVFAGVRTTRRYHVPNPLFSDVMSRAQELIRIYNINGVTLKGNIVAV